MFHPFDPTCKCGAQMEPLAEISPENTLPSIRDKEVTINFWCHNCHHAESFTYRLPRLYDDVAKSVLYYINREHTSNSSLLEQPITFNPLNVLEEQGIRWALGYLQEKNLICNLSEYTFDLTLLGQIMLWHGPY